MDRREAMREAHDIVAALIMGVQDHPAEGITGGQGGWSDDPDDDARIQTCLAELLARHHAAGQHAHLARRKESHDG